MERRVPAEVVEKKKVLRKELLLKRSSQKEKDVLRKSRDIQERLFSLSEFKSAKSVMFYLAKKDEVRTEGMIRRAIEMGKKVLVPSLKLDRSRIIPSLLLDCENDLEEGVFGILEPRDECIRSFPIEEIEVVLVPGIAFDMSGGRIGFGGGYYDGFLAKLPPETLLCGLAFEFQVVQNLPLTVRDVPVERIITEKGLIICQPSA